MYVFKLTTTLAHIIKRQFLSYFAAATHQINGSEFVDSDSVTNDSKRSLLEATGTGDELALTLNKILKNYLHSTY